MAQTPVEYLWDKLTAELKIDPNNDFHISYHIIRYVCGDKWPDLGADASVYYERNHIRGDEDASLSGIVGQNSTARLIPALGGFVIELDSSKNVSARERNFSKWHELAHTLFYKYKGPREVPAYEGMQWRPEGLCTPNKEEEKICDMIAHMVCRQKVVMLGGVPVKHYNLVARLKKEDFAVHYLSESQQAFENHLQKEFYMPEQMVELGHQIILYDLVVFDTRLITRECVEHCSSGKDVLGILSEAVGEPHPEYDSRADYFINSLLPQFNEGLGAACNPVIILVDEEIADAIRPHIEEASGARQDGHLPAIQQIDMPYDIDEVVNVVNSALANVKW